MLTVIVVAVGGCDSANVGLFTTPSDSSRCELDLSTTSDLSRAADALAVSNQTALLCDGIDDRVTLHLGDLLASSTGFTIEFWFRSDRPSPVDFPGEVLLETDNTMLKFTIQDFKGLREISYMGASSASCNSAAGAGATLTRAPSGWHHFAAQIAPSGCNNDYSSAYLDGELLGGFLNRKALPCLGSTSLMLCNRPPNEPFSRTPFIGAIDELRISSSTRYGNSFVPGDATDDAATLALVRFEASPFVDSGPNHLSITAEGNPQLTKDVHE